MCGLLLPSLGTAGGSVSASGSVNVAERKTVGIYDTAVISSPDGSAVLDWLEKNGFKTPTNFLPAIRAYASEGWFFVASKVRLDAPMNDAAKAHPLSFTFQTARPVYPLRLTGINNPHCKIELYVFGKERAEIPNFRVERCEKPIYPNPKEEEKKDALYFIMSDNIWIRHPLLRVLAGNSPVATKLSGDLTSSEMVEDAYLNWVPFAQKRPVLFSYDGASLLATNIAVPILVVAGLIYYLAFGVELRWGVTARNISTYLGLAAVLMWPAVFFGVPKTAVMVSKRPGVWTASYQKDIPEALGAVWQHETNREAKPDAAWVRRLLAGRLTDDYATYIRLTNLFLAQPLREEDSPGNYTLRETTNGLDYVWYDVDAAEHVEPLFRKSGTLANAGLYPRSTNRDDLK
jgi:hypothetical protein